MLQRSLAMIKPDATERKLIGDIIKRIQMSDINIIGLKMVRMTEDVAKGFYYVHEEKGFFEELVKFMSSGTTVVIALEGEDVIARWRTLMGATNPANADPGTIRKEFAVDVQANSVHGSDAPETAKFEISYFFKDEELVG